MNPWIPAFAGMTWLYKCVSFPQKRESIVLRHCIVYPNLLRSYDYSCLSHEMRSLFHRGGFGACETPISDICLWLFFSHALILNKNPYLWMDTIYCLNENYNFLSRSRKIKVLTAGIHCCFED